MDPLSLTTDLFKMVFAPKKKTPREKELASDAGAPPAAPEFKRARVQPPDVMRRGR